MPWCPKCGMEYQEGYTQCSECGIELIEKLEHRETENAELDKEALLTSVANDIEANIVESLLKPYGIPVLKKSVGADGILRIDIGGVIEGIYLYVPSKLLEKAKEILQSQPCPDVNSGINGADECIEKVKNDEVEYQKEFNRKRRIRTWILLGVFYIPTLILMVFGLIYLLFQLFTGKISL